MTLPPMPIVLVLEGSNRIRAWFAASETGYSGSTVAVSRSRKAKWLFHQEKDTLKRGQKGLQVLWNRSSGFSAIINAPIAKNCVYGFFPV